MTGPSLVLAAHGSTDGDNREIERIAERLRERLGGGRVRTAFHRGAPALADGGLHDEAGTVVVPLFTSEGYYSKRVLPDALRRGHAARPAAGPFRITRPIGTHPAVPGLVAERLESAGLLDPDATLVVVGHGTRRDQSSGHATEALARALATGTTVRRVRTAFLDQPPRLERVVTEPREGPLVVFPFLIGHGHHLTVDVPERSRTDSGGAVVAPAFGSLPGLPDLVLDLYHAALPEPVS